MAHRHDGSSARREESVDALSALLIDDAIEIAKAYDKTPDAAPRDIRAAALALAEEVVRLRSLLAA